MNVTSSTSRRTTTAKDAEISRWLELNERVRPGDVVRVVFLTTVDEHKHWIYAWSSRHHLQSVEIMPHLVITSVDNHYDGHCSACNWTATGGGSEILACFYVDHTCTSSDRCLNCDHLISDHTVGGCDYVSKDGTFGADALCICGFALGRKE